ADEPALGAGRGRGGRLEPVIACERSGDGECGSENGSRHACNERSGRQGPQLGPPFHGEYVLVRHADLRVPLHQVRGALQPARGNRTARPHVARVPAVRVARGGAGALAVLRQNGPEKLAAVFERLRDALRAALDAATPPGDLRDLARQMREAVVEAKVAVVETGEAVARTERELAQERQRLADAERRGRLASEIQDTEPAAGAGGAAGGPGGGSGKGGRGSGVGGGAGGSGPGSRTRRPSPWPGGSRRSTGSAWACSTRSWRRCGTSSPCTSGSWETCGRSWRARSR